MLQGVVQVLRFVLPPVGLLALAVALRPWVASLDAAYHGIATYFPLAVIATALAVSWRFNRSRVFFTLATLILTYAASLTLSRPGPISGVIYLAIGVYVPANVALFALLKERGIFSPAGVLRGLVLVAEAGVAYWLVQQAEALTLIRSHWLLAGLEWTPIPPLALLSVAAAIGVLGVRIAFKQSPLDIGLLGVLAAVVVVLNAQAEVSTAAVFFGAAGLVMAVALIQESYSMAYMDELTGLAGRRALRETMLRLGRQYSIAMVDVDHFKRFNDKYGHDVGDQVLRMVATRMRRAGGGGRPYRFGGEEFTLVFPSRRIEDVLPHVEALRRSIEEAPFALRARDRRKRRRAGAKSAPKTVSVTVSIGVAQRGKNLARPEDVLKAADQALYRAKKNGRNRINT